MGVLLAVAVVIGGALTAAIWASRWPGRPVVGFLVVAACALTIRALWIGDQISPALGMVLLALLMAAIVVAVPVGWIASSQRTVLDGIAAPRRDTLLLDELFDLRRRAVALGFDTLPDSIVWLGSIQMTWMSHPDGTVAELVCSPGLDPSFGFATLWDDRTWLVSTPHPHGTDRTKLRLPGASFEELLDFHRSGVARLANGRSPAPPEPDRLVEDMLERERAEAATVNANFWWSCFMAWYRQQRPHRYAQA